jgi:N,N-dimethylformamidase beta subunit-like protein
VPDTRLVRVVFGLLVLATLGAFFITQRLKGEEPVVLRFYRAPLQFSPNGDKVKDTVRVGFDLSERAKVSFLVVDHRGDQVRRLFDDRTLAGDTKHRFTWDGRNDERLVVPDGRYRMQVLLRDQGRTLSSSKEIRVDTRPPRVRLVAARPGTIALDRPATVQVRYSGPSTFAPEFRVVRTDDGPPHYVAGFRGDRSRAGVWNGQVKHRPAADGNYAFVVRVRDKAGNQAFGPRGGLPNAARAVAGTGVRVRRLTAQGPLRTVRPGQLIAIGLGPVARRLSFALSRVGQKRRLRAGKRRGRRFRVRIPPTARAGLHVVRIRAAGRRLVVPVAVSGPPPARSRRLRGRVLVVLPAISWQGLNEWDDDQDGFADTLESGSVRLARPFVPGGLPRRFRSDTEPLLAFLDRARLPYDLTTDLELARRRASALKGFDGVAFAGSARWLTERVDLRLRRFVERGGALASFGTDAFRRRVGLSRDSIDDPGPAEARDIFGEAIRPSSTDASPMSVIRDRLGLFSGTDGLAGLFTRFEESLRLASGARLLTSAGRDERRGAFVAYRLGRGTVIRVGTPDWSSSLEGRNADDEIAGVTRRVWRLLGG